MPRTTPSVRTRARLRGVAVLLGCALLPAPALLAAGDGPAGPEDAVLAAARAQVGDAYRWGGNGPDAWDCSGLIAWAWRTAGGVPDVPRTSAAQQAWTVPLPREQLLPGDLVFWGDPVTHVGLYLGDDRVVDASSARTGVLERKVWSGRVVRYGRVPREGMPPVTPWAAPSASPSPTSSPTSSPAGAQDGKGDGSSAGAPTATPTAVPSRTPAPSRSATPTPVRPATAPVRATAAPASPTRSAAPAPGTQAAWREALPVVAQPGMPRVRPASSARAARALAGARSVVGQRHFTSTGLVREAWRHAGGGLLPRTGPELVARGRSVPLADARPGDLVVYGGGQQLYLYVGDGWMVGHSVRHGSVMRRAVHRDPTLRLVRLQG